MKFAFCLVHFQVLLLISGVTPIPPSHEENTVRPKKISMLTKTEPERIGSTELCKNYLQCAKKNGGCPWGNSEREIQGRRKEWAAVQQTGCSKYENKSSSSVSKKFLVASRTVIIIVDFQNDFCEDYSNATLKVPGSWKSISTITWLLKSFKTKGGKRLVVTKDAHPEDHFSFSTNWREHRDQNGNFIKPYFAYSLTDQANEVDVIKNNWPKVLHIWPPHCVLNTEGFEIHNELKPLIYFSGFDVTNVHKAVYSQRESFSGFVEYNEEEELEDETYVNLRKYFENIIHEVDNIVLFGLEFGKCVKSTSIPAAKILGLPEQSSTAKPKKVIIVSDACYLSPSESPEREAVCSELATNGVEVLNSKSFEFI